MQEMTFDFNLCKRYDIIVPDIKLIIEYQGIQHVKWTKFFHKKYSDFLEYVKNDKEKREVAENHGWKVLYFFYDEPVDDYNYVYNKLNKSCDIEKYLKHSGVE